MIVLVYCVLLLFYCMIFVFSPGPIVVQLNFYFGISLCSQWWRCITHWWDLPIYKTGTDRTNQCRPNF